MHEVPSLIQKGDLPLLSILAGLLLLFPGWYIVTVAVVLKCLGKQVSEDPAVECNGAFVVKYGEEYYRYEDIAQFEDDKWWQETENED